VRNHSFVLLSCIWTHWWSDGSTYFDDRRTSSRLSFLYWF